MSTITRKTAETRIHISLSLDGGLLPSSPDNDSYFYSEPGLPASGAEHSTQFTPTQQIIVNTGIGFLDHMLHALAKHAGWSLGVRTFGDLYST